MNSSIPLGLKVGQTVQASSLPERNADISEFGVSPSESDLRPIIVFSSFSDPSLETYSSYNRVFETNNSTPIRFPSFNETYPDSSGRGVGNGLTYNTGRLAIQSDQEISAIRLKPVCLMSVFTASSYNESVLHYIGTTLDTNDGYCSLQFDTPSSLIVLEHEGSLDLENIELFTSEKAVEFAVFPVVNRDSKSLPFIQSKLNRVLVTRRGGLRQEIASLLTIELSRSCQNTKTANKLISTLSLEADYIHEIELYSHIQNDIKTLFPILSRIEQNAYKHKSIVQRGIQSINLGIELPDGLHCMIQSNLDGGGNILFNGVKPMETIFLLCDVTYTFEPITIEINGTETNKILLREFDIVEFGKNGVLLGSFTAVNEKPKEIFELPTAFMGETSLSEVVEDMRHLQNITQSLSPHKTPNFGDVVTHTAFIHTDGREMTCEESIFLPGSVLEVSVSCSEPDCDVTVSIDGHERIKVNVGEKSFVTVSVQLPPLPGVHCLQSSHGSNVLFRISEKSIIHAPIHPKYYTSGQLEEDDLCVSTIRLLAQHNNFDLIPITTVRAVSNTSLVSIPDVVFDDFSCINAFLCRKMVVDIKNRQSDATFLDSYWEFFPDHPWMVYLNVEHGCLVVNQLVALENFSLLWTPTGFGDVTLFHSLNSLYLKGGELVFEKENRTFGCNATDVLKLSEWNHIAFTSNHFWINGKLQDTYARSVTETEQRSSISRTVIGTCNDIDLRHVGLATGYVADVPDFASDRFNESSIYLRFVDTITSFEMTTDSGIVSWKNVNSDTSPLQTFRPDNASNIRVTQIRGLSIPSSIQKISIVFNSAGYIRNVCNYKQSIPIQVIKHGTKNYDSVLDFQFKDVECTCTNQEQNTISTEQYTQTNYSLETTQTWATQTWLESSTYSSFYVTPPSLVMMSTSQSTPYSITQSLLILFNRRVEVFSRDESTVFTITGNDNSVFFVQAQMCTLLSSQIHIPNSHLRLSQSTSYSIHVAAGRLFHFEGHVPCLEGTIHFTTL